MATLFLILVVLSVGGALAAWGTGVAHALAALAADRAAGVQPTPARYALLLAWPFAVRARTADADSQAKIAGKTQIALFVCFTIAVAATSVYTNLTMRPSLKPAGSSPAGAVATTPSQS